MCIKRLKKERKPVFQIERRDGDTGVLPSFHIFTDKSTAEKAAYAFSWLEDKEDEFYVMEHKEGDIEEPSDLTPKYSLIPFLREYLDDKAASFVDNVVTGRFYILRDLVKFLKWYNDAEENGEREPDTGNFNFGF